MRAPIDVAYNFHWVLSGTLARMAQAHVGGLEGILRRHGIRSVINLRGSQPDYGWWQREKTACERAGARHFDVQLDSRKLPTKPMLVAVFDAFDAAPTPTVVKCAGGQDRTSFAAALYIINLKGWDALTEAEHQFSKWPYLHLPKTHQRWLRHFLAFAKEQSDGAPIGQWVRETYDPLALVEWLNNRGMRDFYMKIYEKRVGPGRQWKW